MAKKAKTSTGNLLTKEKHETKVDRIKAAVKQGTYSVDSREVAKSLIKHTKESSKKPKK